MGSANRWLGYAIPTSTNPRTPNAANNYRPNARRTVRVQPSVSYQRHATTQETAALTAKWRCATPDPCRALIRRGGLTRSVVWRQP
jgi:hypothetical protein